jgi:hypothetical protein
VLTDALGSVLFEVYQQLLQTAAETYQLEATWRFYNDGKAWLCKIAHRKKTICWLSVYHQMFQLSFFFTDITGDYKFNSYRLTYRYDLVKKPRIEFGVGFTAKIRDARIALSSAGLNEEKVNVGFVPIINFRLLWNIDNKFGLLLEGDALAAPQGRAEDVLLAAAYTLSDRFKIRAGYRILEGGADNAEVYTFSLFHYAAVGLSYTLGNKKE